MGNLTALKVKALAEAGRYPDGNGLFLSLSSKGVGSWILRIQSKGKRRDIGLGSMSEISLADAREAATDVRRDIRAGLDPVLERKKALEVVPTFRKAAAEVHDELKPGWKNGKHQKQWIDTLELYAFPKIGNDPVSDIEGPAIRDLLAEIWLEKPETARRVKQRIGTVLDWSYAKGFRKTEAPMRSIAKGLPRQPKKAGHFAAMPYEQVPAFLRTLRSRSSKSRLALEFAIFTATRSGEVRGATWSEISVKKRTWTISAERMKAGEEHVVPLSEQALSVLERAKTFRITASNLIFPGQLPKNPLSDMTLLKKLRDLELPYTVHGFRSSFRDWVAEKTNWPGEVAEAALAHTIENKVEAAYRRTKYLEKRQGLMVEWADFCLPRD